MKDRTSGTCALADAAQFRPKGESGPLSAVFWCALLVSVTAMVSPPYACGQSQVEEYRVKAAFLFHFAQLIEWPASSFSTDGSPLSVCTIGDDPFHGELEMTMNGKSVSAHAVRILHAREIQELSGCQMVFVGASENKRVSSVFAELGKSPVLTIGEADNFIEQGGVIRLFLEEDKVRFDVNLNAAGEAGIKISSRLLLLAKAVTGKRSVGE